MTITSRGRGVTAGRATEVRALENAMVAARTGHGSALAILGEGGIGKSHLLDHIANLGRANGMRVLRGRASAIGRAVTYRPLREALAALTREGNPFPEDDLGPYRAVLGRLIPEWSDPSHVPDADSLVLAEALLRLLALGRASNGCVLILDDLQDADAETMAVVDYLMDNIGRASALLALGLRPEPGPALDVVTAADRRGACLTLQLRRLSRRATHGLVLAFLGDTAESGDLLAELDKHVWAASLGNPTIAIQVLHDLVHAGALRRTAQGWQLVGTPRPAISTSLGTAVADRVEALGAEASRILSTASVFGGRFPVRVVGEMAGCDPSTVLAALHLAREAGLVTFAEAQPHWCEFAHPLAAESLIVHVGPVREAALAAQAVDVIAGLYPDLPEEWCLIGASLRLRAGDLVGAGRLFAAAGRQAMAAGAAGTATKHFERGLELTAAGEAGERAAILEELVTALAEAGEVERALTHISTLAELDSGIGMDRRISLHIRLAVAAGVAGHQTDGFAQLAFARALAGDHCCDQIRARLDLAEAQLLIDVPGMGKFAQAERLAQRAAWTAEKADEAEIACAAWHLVGCVIRSRGLAASVAAFERTNVLAEAHRLQVWRLRSMIKLGGADALQDGHIERLQQASQLANQMGAVLAHREAEENLAMQSVLRGDFAAAASLVEQILPPAMRLRLTQSVQYTLAIKVMLAGHRGRRAEMDRSCAEFRRWDGYESHQLPLALGLGRAFCALVEEDRARAKQELEQTMHWEERYSTYYQLTGRYGLYPLLRILDGDAGPYRAAIRTPASRLRWNRQYLLVAKAIQAGRLGHREKAGAAFAKASHASEPFLMARHLCLRLAAEAVMADGWGEPELWLRDAEAYFADLPVLPVAGACRALLRSAGHAVRQHRRGIERIPGELRMAGVTVREYDVFQLLAGRPTNRWIALRLYISPRTVEKHVASLLAKTRCADRAGLCDYARVSTTT